MPYIKRCDTLLYLPVKAGQDFEVLNTSELSQFFLQGSENSTLCLTTLAHLDDVIEGPEVYQVFLSSTDAAVSITNEFVQITIGDVNTGVCG